MVGVGILQLDEVGVGILQLDEVGGRNPPAEYDRDSVVADERADASVAPPRQITLPEQCGTGGASEARRTLSSPPPPPPAVPLTGDGRLSDSPTPRGTVSNGPLLRRTGGDR